LGKPNKPMLDCIKHQLKLNLERTCMIGDRLDTDISFCINGGISTLLDLTGKIMKFIYIYIYIYFLKKKFNVFFSFFRSL
jgi:ribonucleotide monophosphatase NagD (HAD superfamily)